MARPLENGSGCPDPTAYRGEKELAREEQQVSELIKHIRYVSRMAGFDIINRVELRDRKTRRIYK